MEEVLPTLEAASLATRTNLPRVADFLVSKLRALQACHLVNKTRTRLRVSATSRTLVVAVYLEIAISHNRQALALTRISSSSQTSSSKVAVAFIVLMPLRNCTAKIKISKFKM